LGQKVVYSVRIDISVMVMNRLRMVHGVGVMGYHGMVVLGPDRGRKVARRPVLRIRRRSRRGDSYRSQSCRGAIGVSKDTP
jgi:hypothetical protein